MKVCSRWILLIVLILPGIQISGEEIYIAPLVSVDEGEESYLIDEEFREAIYESIEEQKGFLGVTILKTRGKIKTVRSSYDALKVCREEKIKYLIYGWVRVSEYTYEGELRVFDGEGRKNIISVYEKDGKKEYEKFIKRLSGKVLENLQEIFYIPKEENIERESKINVALDIGYWSFMNKAYGKYLVGIIDIGLGLEIIPNDKIIYIKKHPLYMAVGMYLDYRLGLSKKGAVKGYLNNLNGTGYVNTSVNLNENHHLGGKIGILYALDILRYQDKYSDAKTESSGSFGMLLGVVYKYEVNEKIKITFTNEIEIIFFKKVMSKYIGKVGLEFEVFKKEYKRK